jgi:hypothetical protein
VASGFMQATSMLRSACPATSTCTLPKMTRSWVQVAWQLATTEDFAEGPADDGLREKQQQMKMCIHS